MTKPICVKCQRFYRPKRNGTPFMEGVPIGNGLAPAGLEAPDQWKPYKLWMGDLWECEGCNHEIIVGVGWGPVSEHFLPNFKDAVEAYPPYIQVNDC